jgi:hypothetical protein
MWIRVETCLPRHRKIGRLASLLKVSVNEALGLVVNFLCYVSDFCDDGDVSCLTESDVAFALGWQGEQPLIECMTESGFIDRDDESSVMHGWEEYQRSAREKFRLREKRQQKATTDNVLQVVANSAQQKPTADDLLQGVANSAQQKPTACNNLSPRHDTTRHVTTRHVTTRNDTVSSLDAKTVETDLTPALGFLRGAHRSALSALCPIDRADLDACLAETVQKAGTPSWGYLLKVLQGARASPDKRSKRKDVSYGHAQPDTHTQFGDVEL